MSACCFIEAFSGGGDISREYYLFLVEFGMFFAALCSSVSDSADDAPNVTH